MKMRWVMVLVMSLLVGPCFAQDADAARRAKVEQLLVSMHMDATFERIMDVMKAQVEQQSQATAGVEDMTPAQKKIFAKFSADAMNLATESVSWKAMEPEMVKLYSENFTEQQIDDMSVFYKSSTGQALLEKTPQLTGQMMQFTQARVVDLQPKMKTLTDQFVKDMAAASKPSAAPAPAKAKS